MDSERLRDNMIRIAFWLIIIGTVSLIVPAPVWPLFVGCGLVTAGMVVGVIALVKQSREKKAERNDDGGTLM